jgi:transposase
MTHSRKSYSEDLRQRVIAARCSGMKVSEVCQLFQVDDNSVYRWMARYEATGTVCAKQRGGGKQLKISDMAKFEAFVQANAHATLEQMRERWEDEVSTMCLSRALKRLGWMRKKNTVPIVNALRQNAQPS